MGAGESAREGSSADVRGSHSRGGAASMLIGGVSGGGSAGASSSTPARGVGTLSGGTASGGLGAVANLTSMNTASREAEFAAEQRVDRPPSAGRVTASQSAVAVPAGKSHGEAAGAAGAAAVVSTQSSTASAAVGAPGPTPVPMLGDRAVGRRIEEEAISKLERLGYPRDEIARQLKDESSHLCKLYHRFLKALN